MAHECPDCGGACDCLAGDISARDCEHCADVFEAECSESDRHDFDDEGD